MAEDTALTGGTENLTEASNGQMASIDPVSTESTTIPTYDAQGAADTIDSTVDFGSGYIDNDKSTVQGQLSSLLGSDSNYIKEARRSALEMSAGRGLQNSSIAAGAGETAAIQAGLPIAQQDASTYAQSDLATQSAKQALAGQQGTAILQGEANEQDYSYEATQNAFNRSHELAVQENNFEQATAMETMQEDHATIQAELDRLQQDSTLASQQGHDVKMAGVNYGYNKTLQDLQIASTEFMAQNSLNADESANFQNMTTQIMHDYQTDVTTLISDMNFLEASAGDINSTLESLANITKNNIKFAGSMSGIPTSTMNSYLANAFPG